MAVTRLKRKAKRNKARAKVRNNTIQLLNSKPLIKNVDVEAIKEEFSNAAEKPVKKKVESPKAADKSVVEAEVKAGSDQPVAPKTKKEEVVTEKPKQKATPKVEKEEKPKKKVVPKAKKEETAEKPKKKVASKKDSAEK